MTSDVTKQNLNSGTLTIEYVWESLEPGFSYGKMNWVRGLKNYDISSEQVVFLAIHFDLNKVDIVLNRVREKKI